MIYEFNGYKPVIHKNSFVHKEATIIGNVIIGKNVYIGPGASLRGDWGQITIKDGCNVQDNCIIHIFPLVEKLISHKNNQNYILTKKYIICSIQVG